MIRRNIQKGLLAALSDRPVVLLNGARQTGKTTLVRSLAEKEHPAQYYSLDEAPVLAAASADPAGFLAGLDGPVILDEVQRAPALFLAIKVDVDRARRPGRYLLTGSADVLLLPKLADALPGRMEILTLWPLSQGELEGVQEGLIEVLFEERLPQLAPADPPAPSLWERIVRGGFPEAQALDTERRRDAWFGSYITAILERDVRDLASIAGLTEVPRLLSLLAARGGGLLNTAEVSRSIGLPWNTLKRYMALLEKTFLIQMLPAWSGSLGRRLVKAPKILLVDTGLMASLMGANVERLVSSRAQFGGLVECFVGMELLKQASWSEIRPRMFHFRTHSDQEVDFVLEDRRGRVVGVEVKSSATVGDTEFKGLRALRDATGKRFWRGVLLYTGRDAVPFGDKLHALPISVLWRLGAQERPDESKRAAAPSSHLITRRHRR